MNAHARCRARAARPLRESRSRNEDLRCVAETKPVPRARIYPMLAWVLEVRLPQTTHRIEGGELGQLFELVELGHGLRGESDLEHAALKKFGIPL